MSVRLRTLLVLASALAGCRAPDPPLSPGIHFTEITSSTVGDYAHTVWGELDRIGLGRGTGAALADFDGDGRLDLLLGGRLPVLLHNDGDLRFHALPQGALAGKPALAVATGDLDGDRDPDLVLTGSDGQLWLLENRAGTLVDARAPAGITSLAPYFAPSVLVADLDRDGRADLYLAVMGDPRRAEEPGFDPANLLLRGDGALGFSGGLAQHGGGRGGFTWTAVAFAQPAAVAPNSPLTLVDLNDTFTNPTDAAGLPGTVGDRAIEGGVDRTLALGLAGRHSSMGGAVGDVDGDGALDLFTTDFGVARLFVRRGERFVDEAAARGVSLRTDGGLPWVYWGARLADLDRDGDLDLLVQGARVCPLEDECQAEKRQGTRLLENDGSGGFRPTAHDAEFLHDGVPTFGRALLTGDLDGDGDDDLLACPFVDRFRLFRNDSVGPPSLRVRLRGTASGPDADFALVTHGDQIRSLYAGGDVHGQSERVLDFAFRPGSNVHVAWPSGRTSTALVAGPGRLLIIDEPAK
ncbi:MAG: VCBS repeat-containing protein [Myxococcales bacterium]|nr:VCBS repeat-containing protein [Myxococcales bacterium]